jgi:hypothetical protein
MGKRIAIGTAGGIGRMEIEPRYEKRCITRVRGDPWTVSVRVYLAKRRRKFRHTQAHNCPGECEIDRIVFQDREQRRPKLLKNERLGGPVRGWGREEWGIGHWTFGLAAILD